MRTLKKSLCLVLALVFVLGLCTIGAGAAFTDAESIQYTNAVETMAALGIINGYTDGSFGPNDPVTRGQAAKMVAYVMLGGTAAEKLPAATKFDDVAADAWYAKYVYFASQKGIINGYGNGNFGPDDSVTALQLGKMLLTAIGYGKADEYVGEGWDVNVFLDALELGIFDGVTVADYDAPATREEAAQYIYNMMITEIASYSKLYGDYTPGTDTYGSKVYGLAYTYGLVIADPATDGSKVTTLTTINPATDVAGANKAFVYAGDLDLIGQFVKVISGKNDAVYDVKVLSTAAAAGTKLDATLTESANIKYWVNYTAGASYAYAASGTLTKNIVVYGGKIYGAFDSSFTADTVVAVNATTGAVTLGTAGLMDMTKTTAYEGIKVGDFVIVQPAGVMNTLTAAVKETAVVSQVSGTNYNNGTYKASPALGQVGTSDTVALGGSFDFYLDTNGAYILVKATAAAATANNYVYFVAGYTKSAADEYGTVTNAYYAQCVNAKGEIENYQSAADYSAYAEGVYTMTSSTAPATYGLAVLTAYSGADLYTFNVLADTQYSGSKLPTVPYYINADASVSVISGSKATLKVTALDGLNAKLKAGSDVYAILTGASANKNVPTIWIAGATVAPSTDVTSGVVFVKSATATGKVLLEDNVPAGHDTYNIYVDGVLKTAVPFDGTLADGDMGTATVNTFGVYSALNTGAVTKDTFVLGTAYTSYNGILSGTGAFDGKDFSGYTFVDTVSIVPTYTSLASIEAAIGAGTISTVTFVFQTNAYGLPTGIIYVTAIV